MSITCLKSRTYLLLPISICCRSASNSSFMCPAATPAARSRAMSMSASLSMMYSCANWAGWPAAGISGPSRWCTAPLMHTMLTPWGGFCKLMPLDTICSAQLYNLMLSRSCFALAECAASVSRLRSGAGAGVGNTKARVRRAPCGSTSMSACAPPGKAWRGRRGNARCGYRW
ncbi:MAG: hypothetical protein J3K34DRAFT_449444 [Monoraphidium minutum]|nr:MAG: hypothetical protein J3K34DRAFT_449444 [Monoraphidium minutum]